jgi:tetratricopeptide (TPR) repeat protein
MNTLKKIYTLLILILPLTLWASTPEQQVADANKAYFSGQYEAAIKIYEPLVNKGFASPVLFYNLGNSYFKLGNMPMAILFYEKAKKLAPSDSEIEHNIRLANTRIVDKFESVPTLFYVRWYNSIKTILSPDRMAQAGLTFIALFWVLLAVYFFARRRFLRVLSFYIAILFILLGGFCMVMAYQSYHSLLTPDEAIVIEPSIGVKSSPDHKSIDQFVIHEGTKVRVMDRIGEWKEIGIANGNSGWIESTAIREI